MVLEEFVRSRTINLERCMELYQRADAQATTELVVALSPALLRFFRHQVTGQEQAEDLLQDVWLRIHVTRHTYRPGRPLLPWIYGIARHVRVDAYRHRRRISTHEFPVEVLPEIKRKNESRDAPPDFDTLVAILPDGQREVLSMLKIGGLTLEEVACATSSTVGAVKQKAHRAYKALRRVVQTGVGA